MDTAHRPAVMLDLGGLGKLIDELIGRGYEVWAPVVQHGVIGHDRIESVEELPVGSTDEQAPGRYRLVPRSDASRFGYAVGPQSWKELLQLARTKVWTMTRDESGSLTIRMARTERVPRAFLGVRPCELAAIQNRIGSCVKAPMSIPATTPSGRHRSSSPSIAPTLPPPVSARRWEPVQP